MVEARQTRRRRIEDVASALFRERGYPATSVRALARALDIQGPSLYAHVTSKEDVLWSIVDRAAGRFEAAAATLDRQGTMDRQRALDAPEVLDAPDRLAAFVRAHVRVVTGDVEHASVFVAEWRFLSPARRAAILARRDAYERRLRDLIAGGVARGELAPVDPALGATFVLTALNGIATWYRPDGRLDPDRIADQYADLVLRALGAGRRTTGVPR